MDVSGRESIELGVRGSRVQIQSSRPIHIGLNRLCRLGLFLLGNTVTSPHASQERPIAALMISGLDETPQPRSVEITAREYVRYATTDNVAGCLGEAYKGGSRGELNTHRF